MALSLGVGSGFALGLFRGLGLGIWGGPNVGCGMKINVKNSL